MPLLATVEGLHEHSIVKEPPKAWEYQKTIGESDKVRIIWCYWGDPERIPRGHDVYCTCMRVCVCACMRACVCACMRACVHACVRACVYTYVCVGEACLGVSEVSVAGNVCSLGSDGWLRTSAEGQERLALHSAAGQRSSRRSVSSLRSFYHCMLATCMNVKFALEQPSGTGVGNELA